METLEFTSQPRPRDPQPVEVDLCGETFTVNRPKEAVLSSARVIAADSVSDADRSANILQFMHGTLDAVTYKSWLDRARDWDDPMDQAETVELIAELHRRWSDYDPNDAHIVIEAPDRERPSPDQARVVSQDRAEADEIPDADIDLLVPADFDLDVLFTQPKDLVVQIMNSSLASGANAGQQVWALGYLLDAALDEPTALLIEHRLRSQDPDDLLDLEPMAEIVTALLKRWRPTTANRAQRRAQQRGQSEAAPKRRPGNPGGGSRRAGSTGGSKTVKATQE